MMILGDGGEWHSLLRCEMSINVGEGGTSKILGDVGVAFSLKTAAFSIGGDTSCFLASFSFSSASFKGPAFSFSASESSKQAGRRSRFRPLAQGVDGALGLRSLSSSSGSSGSFKIRAVRGRALLWLVRDGDPGRHDASSKICISGAFDDWPKNGSTDEGRLQGIFGLCGRAELGALGLGAQLSTAPFLGNDALRLWTARGGGVGSLRGPSGRLI